MRSVNSYTLSKIKGWEELRLVAYQDGAGVWTLGWGHTRGVRKGDTCTEVQALRWLREDLLASEAAVNRLVKVLLTDNQFGALVSFVLNVGIEAFATSTLLKKINAGDLAAVPSQLMRWNKITVKGRKVVSRGLTNRRAAEVGLWATGAFVASQDVQPVALAHVSRSRTLQGAAVTSVGTVGAALTDASNQVSVVADYSDTLRIVFIILTLAGIALTIYGRLKLHQDEGV